MSSRQGFDHGSCVVLVSRVEGSFEFVSVGQWKGEGEFGGVWLWLVLEDCIHAVVS